MSFDGGYFLKQASDYFRASLSAVLKPDVWISSKAPLALLIHVPPHVAARCSAVDLPVSLARPAPVARPCGPPGVERAASALEAFGEITSKRTQTRVERCVYLQPQAPF